ncbi:hypothetical protein ACWEPL_47270 [Nonomuraea sp. NPDC004186]
MTPCLLSAPVGTTLHLRAGCDGNAGGKAYLEAEGRNSPPTVRPPVRAAALFAEVSMGHFAKHATVQNTQDYEVNP